MTQESGAVVRPGSSPASWRRVAGWLARQELWLTLPLAVLLAFPNPLSPWAVLGIPALWLCRWAGRGSITRRTPVDLPILVLLSTIPVGLWASADLDRSWPVVYQMMAQVALFYALVNVARSERWLMVLAGGMVLATVAMAALNLTEILVLGERLFSEQALGGKGTFGLPKRNVTGGTLAFLLPIPLALTLIAAWRTRFMWATRALLGLATVIVGTSLLITQTRGAWIGLLVAILVMAIAYNRRFAFLVPVAVIGALLVIWYVGPAQMTELVLALDATNSAQSRWEIWQRGVYMIQDFPFTGVGLGLFSLVGNLLYPLFTMSEYPEHDHNIYLQAAIDHGLPGLVAFAALLMLMVCMAIQAIRRAPTATSRALALGTLGALVVYLTHGLVECITSFARAGIFVWGMLGLIAALWLYVHEPASD